MEDNNPSFEQQGQAEINGGSWVVYKNGVIRPTKKGRILGNIQKESHFKAPFETIMSFNRRLVHNGTVRNDKH